MIMTTNQSAQIENLTTLWICFSLKKVDRRSAIIHVLTNTPPTQGRTVHAK